MPETLPVPRRVVIITHPKLPDVATEAAAIHAYCKEHGLETASGTLEDASLRKRVRENEFDLLVALGGVMAS